MPPASEGGRSADRMNTSCDVLGSVVIAGEQTGERDCLSDMSLVELREPSGSGLSRQRALRCSHTL
jgi:hypothetical protein